MSLLEKIDLIKVKLQNSHALHIAIIDQDQGSIDALIDQSDLEQKDPHFGFTPLHLAVIFKDLNTAKKLIHRKPTIAIEQDFAGWTPWHFAALLDKTEFSEAFESIYNFQEIKTEIRTQLGSSILDLMNFCKRKNRKSEHFYFLDSNESLVKANEQTFQNLTSCSLIFEHALLDKNRFFLRESKRIEPPSFFSPFLEKIKKEYSSYRESPYEHLYLGLVNQTVGWGIYARQNISPGSIIWEFYGELIGMDEYAKIPYSESKVKYAVPIDTYVIDGRFKRSLGTMTNCGFPNAIPIFTYLDDGTPHYFLIALENISPFEEICYDYGFDHPCKEMGYQELRMHALRKFILTNPPDSWKNLLIDLNQKIEFS